MSDRTGLILSTQSSVGKQKGSLFLILELNVVLNTEHLHFNPLPPRRTLVAPFTEISIPFKEGIIKKISYERRAYESVDEKSLS